MRLSKVKKNSAGKSFETRILSDACLLGHTIIKVPEQFINVYGNGPIKQCKTPFDFCGGINGKSIFFDAKATKETRLNIKTYILCAKKVHQFASLKSAAANGDTAGYLVYFYNLRLFTWFDIDVVTKCVDAQDKALTANFGVCQPDTLPIDLSYLAFKPKKHIMS
jgi:penicillin-binding protein-related factor A (putative recombinase)